MDKQQQYLRRAILKITVSVFMVSCVCGCMFFKLPKRQEGTTSFNEFKKQGTVALDTAPNLLIRDYRDMKEDEHVSWMWVRPGFELRQCRSFEIAPVTNSSTFSYPWAEEKIAQWLKKIFSSSALKGDGTMDAEVKCVIADMRPRKKLTSRLLPFEEDFVYIEIQLVLLDKNTKDILCAIIHGKRTEDFKTCVDGMMKDVEQYFLKGAPRKQ